MEGLPILALDKAFSQIVDRKTRIQKVADGFRRLEAPLFSRIGYLLFSDLNRRRIMRWTPDPGKDVPPGGKFQYYADGVIATGLTFDHQGRLLICQRDPGQVIRIEKDGSHSTMVSTQGETFLSDPQDLVYGIDGSIYFSNLGSQQNPAEPVICRLSRQGNLTFETKQLRLPWGVALGPQQRTFYATDRAAWEVWSFPIQSDGSLEKGKTIVSLQTLGAGEPGGLKTDESGNLYVTAGTRLWVFQPDGKPLGSITFSEPVSNCNWGAGFLGLYVTARTSFYYLETKIPGTPTY